MRFFSCLVGMLFCVLSGALQAQTTGGHGAGGGGGVPPAITIEITSDVPAGGGIIGNEYTFSFISPDGIAPYTHVWTTWCGERPFGPIPGTTALPFQYCFDTEGTFTVHLYVEDSRGIVGEDQVTVSIAGPDDFEPDTDEVSNASTGPGTPLTVIHKWTAQVAGVDVGICWDEACVYEWGAFAIDTTGNGKPDSWDDDAPDDVATWNDDVQGFQHCPGDPRIQYYWQGPYIYDKKIFTDPGEDWTMVDVGAVLKAYKHWVAVKVPICGDATRTFRYLKKGPYIFHIIHVGGGKVKHELQD